MAEELPAPKVFISYSWTSDEHVKWVVKLAERLVSDGVDVVLDQWDFKEGHDKYAFMERMVTDPSVVKVLAVCDNRYAEKADGREGGVGTESQIISRDVYDKTDQEKFIPLIRERDESGVEYIPVFLRNRKYIDFCAEDDAEQAYERLIRNIFGKPERVKPALGKPPAHLLADSAPAVHPAGKLTRLRSAIEKNSPHTGVMLQEYLDDFLENMEQFRIKATDQSKVEFDEVVVQSITDFTPYRDSFIEMVLLASSYMDSEDTQERLIAFMEGMAAYQERPDTVVSWRESQTDNYRFIAYELYLYLIAALIRNKRYATAAVFMEHRYHITKTLGGSEYYECGIHAFNEYVSTLDERRNARLKLNLLSVTADLIVKRATHAKVTVRDVLQVDFLLCIRGHFPNPEGGNGWYPRTVPYLGHQGTLELFAKATSAIGFKALQQLLKTTTPTHLALLLEKMIANPNFQRSIQGNRFLTFNIRQLLNLDNLPGPCGS